MARFALIVGVALFAACSALPATLPSEEIQHLTDDLSQAEDNIAEMTKTEDKEQKQMADVATAIKGLPNAKEADPVDTQMQIADVADRVHNQANRAADEEGQQQKLALEAVDTVDEAIDTIEDSNKKALGEGAAETPVEHALSKLKQVSSTLHQGSKTMHTQERLERMGKEADQLFEEANMAKLGESKDEGALSSLAKADEASNASGDLIHQETQQLGQLLKQEKKVERAEEADKSEMNTLMKKLS